MQISFLRCAALLAVTSTITLNIGCGGSTPAAAPATAPVLRAAAASPPPTAMSAATTTPVIEPATLKFSDQSIKSIQAGTKIATVRKGVRAFPAGVIKVVDGANDSLILQNVVTTPKKISELTEGDAKANGSDSLDELKADLGRDYPGIGADDVVTVITFRLAPSAPAK